MGVKSHCDASAWPIVVKKDLRLSTSGSGAVVGMARQNGHRAVDLLQKERAG